MRECLSMIAGGNSFHRMREGTPSTACGRSPSLEEEGLLGGVTGGRENGQVSLGGRAKGDRGDRKAPIGNRRQGRRP